MLNNILATKITQVSELKKSPMSIITEGNGETVAVLNRNEPVFYCVPAKQYEEMMEKLEDAHLVKIVQSRSKEKEIPVDIDEL
ncbi:MAG: antitoxin [Rickettsiales bacterium]